jgi:hypothetical protein
MVVTVVDGMVISLARIQEELVHHRETHTAEGALVRGQVVVGETCTERFHVCPARSIHRDTGVKRREWPSHILEGSGTLGEVAVILSQATSAGARFSARDAREPGHARATRPGR